MARIARIAAEDQPRIERITRIKCWNRRKQSQQRAYDLPHNSFVSFVTFCSICMIRRIRSIRGFPASIRGIREIRGSSSFGCGWAALGLVRVPSVASFLRLGTSLALPSLELPLPEPLRLRLRVKRGAAGR